MQLIRLRSVHRNYGWRMNCSVNDCHRPSKSRGWCTMHYHRWQRYRDPLRVHPKGGLGVDRPKTPKALQSSTSSWLYWAAGFLEGEGWFTRGTNGSETVGAKQVQREPLERLARMFGGSIDLREQGSGGGVQSRQPVHTWHVYGGRARGVMFTLFTMLSPKRREEIQRALAYAGR